MAERHSHDRDSERWDRQAGKTGQPRCYWLAEQSPPIIFTIAGMVTVSP